MNTATQTPNYHPRSAAPTWRALTTRLDTCLLSLFRDTVRAEDRVGLTQHVWTRFFMESRVNLFAIARGVLLQYCAQQGYDPDPPVWAAQNRLRAALRHLAVDTRILLELRYSALWSARELAALYQLPVDVLRERLEEARRELDAQLMSCGSEP